MAAAVPELERMAPGNHGSGESCHLRLAGMDERRERAALAEAEAARRRGDLGAMMEALGRAVAANPGRAEVRRELARVMSVAGDRWGAVEHMRQALAAHPDRAAWHADLGEMLMRAGLLEEALESLRRAEEMDPTVAAVPGRMALLCRRLRDEEGARAAAERALAIEPDQEMALLAMAQIEARAGRLDEAEECAGRVMAGARDEINRASGWHELGNVLEKKGRFDEAFDAHISGNKLKLGTPVAREAMRSMLQAHFPAYLGHGDAAARYRAWAERSYDDGVPEPVVLTGFPRSGTTMAEQILAAHPRLATCEERALFVPVRTAMEGMLKDPTGVRPLLEQLEGLTDRQVMKLRGIYREWLVRSGPEDVGDRVLIDKHPLRTLDLGLMNRLFPGARVVFMIRDPRDVCLSAMFQDFAINPAMVRFFSPQLCADWYAKVMGFWLRLRGVLGIEVLEVRYEDLVGDFDTWSRRMVEFAGVEWDEGVREFHKGARERVVRSSSFEAVTEKLHKRAMGRWKRYAGKMGPMLERLEPFVEAFGYEPSGSGSG